MLLNYILTLVLILGYPLVRFTNDATYRVEPLTPVELVLVTHGEVCTPGSLDDFVHCANVD